MGRASLAAKMISCATARPSRTSCASVASLRHTPSPRQRALPPGLRTSPISCHSSPRSKRCAAIGVRQLPSSFSRKARSAIAAARLGSWESVRRTSRSSVSASSRVTTPMMPCPAAGSMSSSGTGVATSERPSRVRPAMARKVASARPSSSLRMRVATLPRKVTTCRSGRRARACASRRRDAVPSFAPSGRSRIDFAAWERKPSRGSSRSGKAAKICPAGNTDGTSFRL